jgi:methionine sulfoxide reductase heme-binding subunit
MNSQPALRPSNQPLGTGGDWRRRILFHHAPLALASAVVLVLFMNISSFDVNKYLPGDLFSGTLPKEFNEEDAAQHGGPEADPTDSGARPAPQQQGEGHQPPEERGQDTPQEQGADHQTPEERRDGRVSERAFLGLEVRQFTVASGYVATGLLALTLLVGPANLLLRRRHPVSSYLARDVGMWAAAFSAVHVIYGTEVHASITDPIAMFVRGGSPLTNSFGIANWTGLAATVIVVGLLAISSDLALRKLKARTWKNLQRLNYALFALVILHAFFYGALLRTESPFTLLLILSGAAVFVGQAAGVWLWRRRHASALVAAAT